MPLQAFLAYSSAVPSLSVTSATSHSDEPDVTAEVEDPDFESDGVSEQAAKVTAIATSKITAGTRFIILVGAGVVPQTDLVYFVGIVNLLGLYVIVIITAIADKIKSKFAHSRKAADIGTFNGKSTRGKDFVGTGSAPSAACRAGFFRTKIFAEN